MSRSGGSSDWPLFFEIGEDFLYTFRHELPKFGFEIEESGSETVKSYLVKIIESKKITNVEELKICSAAFISAAMSVSRSQGHRRINDEVISGGWEHIKEHARSLVFCPPNTPPHLCAKSTILDNEEKLDSWLPQYRKIKSIL